MTTLNSITRPFQVTFLGWLFIVVEILSTAHHLVKGSHDRWMIAIVLVGAIAIVAGVFLLRGANWARWLAFHAVASALNSVWDALPHIVLLLVINHVLLGPLTSKYFHPAQPE